MKPAATIADADVCATKPEHCEGCGGVVMQLLVNDPNATRRWVPATWNSTLRAWAPHTAEVCARARVTE